MNIRLSYHDMNMFLAILNSLPEQALKAANRESRHKILGKETSMENVSGEYCTQNIVL